MPASGSRPCSFFTSCLIGQAAWHHHCSTAISACEKAGQGHPALRLLHVLPERRLPRDTITCGTAVSACEKAGRVQWALRLL